MRRKLREKERYQPFIKLEILSKKQLIQFFLNEKLILNNSLYNIVLIKK